MAFLPERNFLEETLVSNFNLSGGTTAFTSSNISKFTIISFQITTTNILGSNIFVLEQSNDGINWIPLNNQEYELSIGSGSLVIEKSFFSGKYVRVNLTSNNLGLISINLFCKR